MISKILLPLIFSRDSTHLGWKKKKNVMSTELQRKINAATSARSQVTSLLIVLSGKLNIDPSMHTATLQTSHTDREKTMSRRDMIQSPEKIRKMVLMMTRRISIINTERVLPRNHIPLDARILTVPRPILVKR